MNENKHHNQSKANDDVALAKILQQQERAFLELRGGAGTLGESLSAHEYEEAPPPGMTEDEKLAWSLMREEEAMFQQRMMAMAWVGTSVGGVEGDVDGVQSDEDDEDDIDEDNIDEGDPMEQQDPAHEQGLDQDPDPDDLTYEELTTLGDLAGTVACGLTDEQMGRLVRSTYASSARKHGGDPCIVCQLDFEPADTVIQLPTCEHVFHDECLAPWLERKKTCPTCSRSVFEE